MHISWHGHYATKIVSKPYTIVLDPYDLSVGLAPFRAKADIVALSNPSDPSMSHTDGVQGVTHMIDTAGEYALDGITLYAFGWHADDGSERTVQLWNIEGISLLYLGARTKLLTNEELQEIERRGIDVVIAPVGGGSGFTAEQAIQTITTVEPRIVIPIHYHVKGVKEKLDTIDTFAKEMGVSTSNVDKKVTIKANKLPVDDMQTVLLKP